MSASLRNGIYGVVLLLAFALPARTQGPYGGRAGQRAAPAYPAGTAAPSVLTPNLTGRPLAFAEAAANSPQPAGGSNATLPLFRGLVHDGPADGIIADQSPAPGVAVYPGLQMLHVTLRPRPANVQPPPAAVPSTTLPPETPPVTQPPETLPPAPPPPAPPPVTQPRRVRVPDLLGTSFAEAYRRLAASGLRPSVVPASGTESTPQIVTAQRPLCGRLRP